MRFASALLAFLVLSSCTVTPDDPKLVALREANVSCSLRLSEAAYEEALEVANATLAKPGILAADPKLADELRFCQALAKSFYLLNKSSTIIKEFVLAMADLFQPQAAPGEYQAQAGTLQSTILDNVLTAILDPLIADLEEINATYATIVTHGTFVWRSDRLPVKLAGTELFDAAGTYDLGEVEILRGTLRAVLSSLYALQALDYRVNIPAIVEYVKLTDSPIKHYQEHPIAAIFNASAVLLGTAPNFMALKEQDGAALMAKAGAGYTAAVKSLLDASEIIKARGGDQRKHVIEYKRDGDQDYFIVHLQFNKELSESLKIDLEKFTDTSIPLREDVLRSMRHVYESLKAGGGVRASVQEDVFPIVALISVVALRSGALDAALADILGQIDPDLAAKIQVTIDYGEMSQEHFLALLLAAVPAQMEVDLGRYYAQPSNLRDVLPAWFQPDADAGGNFAMADFTEATFVIEYECAANPLVSGAKNKIFCDGPVDKAHFSALGTTFPWKNQASSNNFGPLWEGAIAADSIDSRGPYIGFKDPTFGGTLFMDYSTISVPSPTGETVAPANQAALNRLLALVTEAALTIYQPSPASHRVD